VPALLKILRGVHEVISTIMFNWIGRWLVPFLITMYFLDPIQAHRSFSVPETMWFYNFIILSDFSAAIFLSAGVAVVIYFFLWFSPLGFELRMSGLNFDATRYSGVNPQRSVFLAFILGGITAGLAGGLKIMTNASSRAIDTELAGFGTLGFDGIAAALIGRNHPLGVIIGGILLGALAVGAREMQRASGGGVPLDMIRVVQGIIIIVMAVPELHRMFTVWRTKRVRS
jgi:simple sugar transport system permease protein